MSDFIVSARKYRPSTFGTVVGQDSITRTLENAIRNNQLAHAYLFCGPRGVGKTSCARIFAKTINQENAQDDRDFSFNIFELDAASNNKVEDIRQLIDQVRIQPQVGKYKVYIIDEVHMLTKQAFNAFLKTLEEPPSHAIFILATTEKHKILPTILSRCQIYDFNRITTKDIASHLAYVAGEEGVNADEEALHLLAQKADGALRDALSIFDQIVSFNGKNVTYEKVLENLNILDFDFYFRLTELIKSNDRSGIFLIVEEVLANGFELSHFASGFSQHLRDLMVCKDQGTVELLEVSDRLRNKYLEQAQSIEEKFLLNGLHFMNEAEIQLKTVSNPRILVELSLMKIANLFGKPKEKKTPDFRSVVTQESLADKPNISEKKDEEVSVRQELEVENSSVAKKADKVELVQDSIKEKESTNKAFEQSKVSSEQDLIEQKSNEENSGSSKSYSSDATAGEENIVPSKPKILRSKNSISLNLQDINVLANERVGIAQVAEEKADYKVSEKALNSEEIEFEKLIGVWNDYAQILKQNGKYNLYSFFTSNNPSFQDNIIKLIIDNKVLESSLLDEKQDLVSYLRKSLLNDYIDFEYEISETKNIPREVGSRERFEQMTKENPLLKEFQEQLDLGIE